MNDATKSYITCACREESPLEEEIPRAINSPNGKRARRAVQLAALVLLPICISITFALGTRASSSSTGAGLEPASPGLEPAMTAQASGDFSKFQHTNPQHARLPCLLCHRREDNSPRPKLSGHMPCSGCHTQQFADAASPICTVCHTNAQSGALKNFPPLKTFGVNFDHATHVRGASQPRQSCATCHKPARRGVALSIPAGVGAHSTCFQCHAPRAQSSGRDISSCGVCHHIGGFARTPEDAASYRVNFNHSEHTSKGLGCAECHSVRSGAAQRRQVTTPSPLMHHAPRGAKSCISCHNDKRAFGGDDFKDCSRCHRGNQWHF